MVISFLSEKMNTEILGVALQNIATAGYQLPAGESISPKCIRRKRLHAFHGSN